MPYANKEANFFRALKAEPSANLKSLLCMPLGINEDSLLASIGFPLQIFDHGFLSARTSSKYCVRILDSFLSLNMPLISESNWVPSCDGSILPDPVFDATGNLSAVGNNFTISRLRLSVVVILAVIRFSLVFEGVIKFFGWTWVSRNFLNWAELILWRCELRSLLLVWENLSFPTCFLQYPFLL